MGPGLPALQKTQGTTMEAKMVAQGQAHENRYWVEVPFPSWRLAPQPPLHRQAQATYRVLLLSFRSLVPSIWSIPLLFQPTGPAPFPG